MLIRIIVGLSFSLLLLGCKVVSTSKPMNRNWGVSLDWQGHRGCRGIMPENTIAGMLKAIDLGVTTLELDVVISKDGQVVVSHDPYFNATITTCSDGTAISPEDEKRFNLYQMQYDSIQQFDVGLKYHPGFPNQQKLAAFKPLLIELIKAANEHAAATAKPLPWFNIETKCLPSTDHIFHPSPAIFVEKLWQVIQNTGISERTIIQSFDYRTLQEARRNKWPVKLALLIEDDDQLLLENQLSTLGFVPDVYSPHYTKVTPELIAACHEKGMKVIPWTVNKPEMMQSLKDMGVDGLISDYPNLYNSIR